jgi:hypothetical protein|tara:strand:+ start:170 stop:364 length:195 start_codon:yes stop_codon:yes gene_type:complete
MKASDMLECLYGIRAQWGDLPVVITKDKDGDAIMYNSIVIVTEDGEITEEGEGDPEVIFVLTGG